MTFYLIVGKLYQPIDASDCVGEFDGLEQARVLLPVDSTLAAITDEKPVAGESINLNSFHLVYDSEHGWRSPNLLKFTFNGMWDT